MPTMVTFHARRVAPIVLLAALAAGCSREQQDWRSAEAADTTEGWTRFIEQHPGSELVAEARAHIGEIAEARDWQHASRIATVAAYREFLTRHPNGRRSEDARIRIEAFSLGSAPRLDLGSPSVADANGRTGVPALQIATGAAPDSGAASEATEPSATGVISRPEASRVAAAAPPATSESPAAFAPAAPSSGSEPRGLAAPGEAAQPAPAATEAPAAMYAAVTSTEAPATTAPAVAVAISNTIASRGDASGYGVQLGAFGSEASADREWQRLQGQFSAQLNGLSPHITLTSTTAGQLYRLQVAANGEAQARAICDSLRGQSQACVPVLPQLR